MPDTTSQKRKETTGRSRSIEKSRINRNGLPKGTRAPSFRLPSVAGTDLSLSQFLGRRVLLVFSDPDCGPCHELAPKLQNLHCERPDIAVLMISRRDLDATRQKAIDQGLTFPIALQRHWEISLEYGLFATPSGYLINSEGIIEADPAIGSDAILSLVDRSQEMGDRLEARLVTLRREYDTGVLQIYHVEQQLAKLRETVIRISGAIALAEELLSDTQSIAPAQSTIGSRSSNFPRAPDASEDRLA
jgi:peroxiredoxin